MQDEAEKQLEERIKKHEGLRLSAYMDSEGHATIGWGHRIRSISPDRAQAYFDRDLREASKGASWLIKHYDLVLSDEREGVLIEMCFQMGLAGVRKFKRMLAALQQKDYAGAAVEMRQSRWHKQTPNRCERLARVMETGQG